VTEPLLVAMIGVGGVVLGAFGSGAVQAYLAWSERERDARSAARILYMQLHTAEGAIEDLLRLQDWDRMVTDWHDFGRTWDKHSEGLARTINTIDFHVVSSAFSCIASLARVRDAAAAANEAKPPRTPPGINGDLYMIYRANIAAAKKVAFRASFTSREIRRGDCPEPDSTRP
jgi:hypothetical protein